MCIDTGFVADYPHTPSGPVACVLGLVVYLRFMKGCILYL